MAKPVVLIIRDGWGINPSGEEGAVADGNVTLLGALSYFAPLLSTVLLVLTGRATPSWALLAATVLIVGGAGLAALGLRGRGKSAA